MAARGCLSPGERGREGANVRVAVSVIQIGNGYSAGYNDGISVDCEQYAKLGGGCNYLIQWKLG